MPHKDPEARRAYHREYSERRHRAAGHAPLGSDEHRAKASASAKEGWKKRKRVDQSGEKNPNWKGVTANWNTIHWWLRRNFPKKKVCDECGAEGRTDYAFTRHPEPYTRDIADYREMCRRCHIAFDA